MRYKQLTPAWARTREFLALQALWYKKLKNSGFKDLETPRAMRRNFIVSAIPSYDALFHFYFNECLAYFHTTKWKDPFEEHIFFQHSTGASNETIANDLPKHGFKKVHRTTVARKLTVIRNRAGIPHVEFNSSLGG